MAGKQWTPSYSFSSHLSLNLVGRYYFAIQFIQYFSSKLKYYINTHWSSHYLKHGNDIFKNSEHELTYLSKDVGKELLFCWINADQTPASAIVGSDPYIHLSFFTYFCNCAMTDRRSLQVTWWSLWAKSNISLKWTHCAEFLLWFRI